MPTGIRPPPVWDQAALEADFTLDLPGGVPMFFRRIPAGSFRMGARGRHSAEEPPHRVEITREVLLGTFVVTQEQYRAVAEQCPALRDNPEPSDFKGPRRPAERVSWQDATAFCDWLTAWPNLPSEIAAVRLPTEAEWEYACRGGSDTEFYSGDGESALAEVAWYDENSGNESHPVDERPESHPFGLHGMHGNVWEWCRDAWDASAYRKRIDGVQDPEVSGDTESFRVLRGGSWSDTAFGCRSAFRFGNLPLVRFRFNGFRVCLVRGPASGRGAPEQREAEPAAGEGGRGTSPEADAAGGAEKVLPDLTKAKLPRAAGKDFVDNPDTP